MNLPVNLDANNLGTFIYIIMVVLWVVGNVLSKSKKGKKRSSIPRPDESSTEKELREFLETISGKPAADTQEMVKPQLKPVKVRPRPNPELTHITPPRPRVIPELTLENIPDVVAPLPVLETAPVSSFSKTLSSRGSQWRMPGLSMTALRYALSTNRPIPITPLLDTNTLRDKNELRKIIGGKIILGPPRAFDPYDGVGDYKSNP